MSKAKFLRPGSATRRWGEFAVLLCIAAFFGYCGLSHGSSHSASSTGSPTVHAVSAHKTATPRLRTKPIEQIQLGERIPGSNPELSDEDRNVLDPDPATWRRIKLRMVKDSGRSLWIEFLRPLDWLESNEVWVGGRVWLEMPELGAQGRAEVLSLSECPPIQPGAGHVVTGTFRHEADDNVLRLTIEGQPEATEVTETHPYWSLDRQDFVPAGQLEIGERLETVNGNTSVLAIEALRYQGFVHNLEVHGEHVYRVGSLGALVHNNGCLVIANMTTLDLSSQLWRQATFSNHGLVYLLRDKATGQVLKVGQTTAEKFVGRFEKYVTAANVSNRQLVVDVFDVPIALRGQIEGQIRRAVGEMFGFAWDNTGRRLGRPGPGIPFLP